MLVSDLDPQNLLWSWTNCGSTSQEKLAQEDYVIWFRAGLGISTCKVLRLVEYTSTDHQCTQMSPTIGSLFLIGPFFWGGRGRGMLWLWWAGLCWGFGVLLGACLSYWFSYDYSSASYHCLCTHLCDCLRTSHFLCVLVSSCYTFTQVGIYLAIEKESVLCIGKNQHII